MVQRLSGAWNCSIGDSIFPPANLTGCVPDRPAGVLTVSNAPQLELVFEVQNQGDDVAARLD